MEARNKKIGELKYAINFDFTKLKKFELYRRKDLYITSMVKDVSPR